MKLEVNCHVNRILKNYERFVRIKIQTKPMFLVVTSHRQLHKKSFKSEMQYNANTVITE